MKTNFKVTGMMCSSCQIHVENAVSSVKGVKDVSVSLLTNTMTVEHECDEREIVRAVRSAGYFAKPIEKGKPIDFEEEKQVSTVPLIVSLVLSALVMYVEMGQMLKIPYPAFLSYENSPTVWLLIQLLLTVPIVVLNYRYFIGGGKSLLLGAPNMDSLIAIGSGTAILYSTAIFILTLAGVPDLYMKATFSSGGMILSLVTLGKMLEGRAKDKTISSIRALSKLTPNTVNVLVDGQIKIKETCDLTLKDIVILRTGDRIPCDGVLKAGNISLDDSAVTGESLPKEIRVSQEVYQGCIVLDGYAELTPTRVGEETSLSEMIRMVAEASSTKAPIAKLADKVAGKFVPAVLGIAGLTLIAWWAFGGDFSVALTHAISVLVISCPCALGLATPTAITCAMGRGAECGILIKNATAIETIGRIKKIAFDKTGTLTEGVMSVIDEYVHPGCQNDEFYGIVSAVERESAHPIAKAIVDYTNVKEAREIKNFSTLPGKGVFAKVEGTMVGVGNRALMEDCEIDLSSVLDFIQKNESRGAAVIFAAKADTLLGAFAVSDTVKEDAPFAIAELKSLGISSVMLTGDCQAAAKSVGRGIKIEEIYASLSPLGKGDLIEKLSENGKIAMVGDGINDALPLVRADVGIAMGKGTDVAMESCDVVLKSGKIDDVVKLIKLGRLTLKKIKQNLFWALIYNAVCIPVAAGALSFLGITLSPMIASIAMACSSLTVVTNALTIKRFK